MLQIYVNDIVIGWTSQRMVEQFMEHIQTEFEINLVGELTYFLGFQVRQTNSDAFVSQVKYAKNLDNKFGLDTKKYRRTPIETYEKLPEIKLVMVLVTPFIVPELV